MNIREEQEKYEHEHLSRFASFSDESQGRDRPEEPCTVRPAYQRDRDRILHCKSFRRLKHCLLYTSILYRMYRKSILQFRFESYNRQDSTWMITFLKSSRFHLSRLIQTERMFIKE